MNDTLQFVTGLVLGFLASVPTAMLIAALTRRKSRRVERSANTTQIVEAELVTDNRLAIPKEDYLASVKALGDKMASPDPNTRHLAALAYDAFKEVVRPS